MTTRIKPNCRELFSVKGFVPQKFNSESKQIKQTHGYLNRAAKSLKEPAARTVSLNKNSQRKESVNVYNIVTCS